MVAVDVDSLELFPHAYATAVRLFWEAGTAVVTLAESLVIGFLAVAAIPMLFNLTGLLVIALLGAPAWALLALSLHG